MFTENVSWRNDEIMLINTSTTSHVYESNGPRSNPLDVFEVWDIVVTVSISEW